MPKTKILTYAGIGSASLLATLPALFTLAPVFNPVEDASAADPVEVYAAKNANVTVGSALSISAENISISATPSVDNSFITSKSNVVVKNTGSPGGYHLIMSSANEGALKDGDKSINTFSEYSKGGSDMRTAETSSWGYTLDSVKGTNQAPVIDDSADLTKTYYPIPTSTTSWNETADKSTKKYAYLKNTTGYTNKTSGDTVAVGYAFAIGPDTTAGAYSDTITYTAIANRDNRTIFDLTYMQDLASYDYACENTPTPAVRTGDSPDTAVTESINSLGSYTVGQKGIDKIPTKVLTDIRDNNTYTIKKLADGHCWMTDNIKIAGKTLKPGDSNVTEDYNLPAVTPVANMPVVAPNDEWGYVTQPYISNEGVDGTYLYNFVAATAGVGSSEVTTSTTVIYQDICPKGWHMPNNYYYMSSEGHWPGLLRDTYSIIENYNKFSNSKVNWGTYNALARSSSNPLGLKITGLLSPDIGSGYSIDEVGGHYWARTAGSNDVGYSFEYGEDYISIEIDEDRRYGMAVRCVSE